MITAEEANHKTKYQDAVNGLLTQCEKEINKAIDDGNYSTNVIIYRPHIDKWDFKIIKDVEDTLKEYGYHVEMIGDSFGYIMLKISWEEVE